MNFVKSLFQYFKKEKSYQPFDLLQSIPEEKIYVAFIDILGFGNKVQNDFQNAVSKYDEILENLEVVQNVSSANVRLKVLSDSMILVSPNLVALSTAAQNLSLAALFADLLVRGEISFGAHKESNFDGNFYLVSEPLVEAVKLEKEANYPRILLSTDIKPSISGDIRSNFEIPLLYYEDSWIVNPFNLMWGYSAATRVINLKERYPQHQEKYDWFLSLYERVKCNKLLLPDI